MLVSPDKNSPKLKNKKTKKVFKGVVNRIYKNLTRADGWAASGKKRETAEIIKKMADDF